MLATARATYAVEPLSDHLWAEMIPLFITHYHEVAKWKDIPLAPSRAGYQKIADSGMLRIITARAVDSELVGYVVFFVTPALHYHPHLFASQDVLYVKPSCRGSRIGVDMLKFAHEVLAADGVTAVLQHSKTDPKLDIGPMLTRLLGYESHDHIYSKRLDRE